MKKNLFALFAVFLLLHVGALRAQEHRRMMGDPTQAIAMQAARIAEILQLTPDQKTQFDSVHQELSATIGPLFQQSQAAHDQLHALLSSDNPDATAVGRQAIAAHNLEKAIQAAHQTAIQKVQAFLTPEQKAKFDVVMTEHGPNMHAMAAPCGMHQ